MSADGLDFGPSPGIPGSDAAVEPGSAAAAGPGSGAAGDGAAGEGLPLRSPLADPALRRGDDDFDRSLRPKTLAEFVGQRRVREQLSVFIDAARGRDEALDHALFAGPPGLGKCVTPDTMLLTTHGMVPIGTLGDLHGESWQPITRQLAGLYGTRVADYFYNNGVGETLRIETESGYRLEGTPNHPVLVRGHDRRLQFRRLGEVRQGDEVAVRLGAQLFGSATKLHVEGIKSPSLSDPAVVPDELTPDLARLLGLLLVGGRMSPGGDGVVVTSADEQRSAELVRLFSTVFCLQVERFGDGPLGVRYAARSPRVATFLEGLGLERGGFAQLPAPVYRAPKRQVAEFLRGVFWGVEHAPLCTVRERAIAAHLQLMLANFGIESSIAPAGEQGFSLRAEVASPDRESVAAHETGARERDDVGDDDVAFDDEVAAAAAAVVQTELSFAGASIDVPPQSAATGVGELAEVGFGMTPAGVLVALGRTDDGGEYRRGSAISDDITRVQVRSGARVSVESGSAVTTAEVEPAERGRALLRERDALGDGRARALAVRSVKSRLRPDDVVELVWQQVSSIEAGYAHTCDVSVPDGHTFVGNGIVCHNTTLASVVANELGSTMHQTSGPALEKKADVAAILTSLGPRDVLFIDEIHRLNTAIEEVLYSAMEDYQIDIVLGQGPAARTLRLEIEPFTLVGATTRTGLLTTPLRDRFGLIQRLEYYDADELQQVVLRSARLLSIEIDVQAAAEIASRSRGTPRIANRLLRRVRDVAQVRHTGEVTLDVAREALDLVDIDGVGLDRVDRMILENILQKFGGGPVGLSTLAVAIGEEPHTLEDVYEPFLLQRGFIQRTPRGRIVTELGRAHLGARPATPSGGGPGLF